MIFRATELSGAFVVAPEPHMDERGFFARMWSAEEYAQQGLVATLSQNSISFNPRRGTLRGMHWQVAPDLEAKTVRCTMGVVYDVIVDLRPASPTFLKWIAHELSAENRLALYVPPLCAHGFLTLTDATEVEYAISAPQATRSARGLRWNDPAAGIAWPFPPVVIGERDRTYPLLRIDA